LWGFVVFFVVGVGICCLFFFFVPLSKAETQEKQKKRNQKGETVDGGLPHVQASYE